MGAINGCLLADGYPCDAGLEPYDYPGTCTSVCVPACGFEGGSCCKFKEEACSGGLFCDEEVDECVPCGGALQKVCEGM